MPIPALNADGVLPPHNGDPANLGANSPYSATTLELCEKFSATPERRAILKGFLELRQALRQLQIVDGFQWVDGPFLEDDRHQRKAPDHLQVVTFSHPSPLEKDPEFSELLASVTDRKAARSRFRVDHMPVRLSWPMHLIITHASHYCGRLSHQQETGVWKGLLKIDLNTVAEDQAALQHLASLEES
jgi:hypothetical protein